MILIQGVIGSLTGNQMVGEPPPAPSPSKERTSHMRLNSEAARRARERHAQLATHWTAGQLAAWDDIPCRLLPPHYPPSGEAAREWLAGFDAGWQERQRIGGAA